MKNRNRLIAEYLSEVEFYNHAQGIKATDVQNLKEARRVVDATILATGAR